MKLSTAKKSLAALFLIAALILICGVAAAEIEGSGTETDPYLISSFTDGQTLPGNIGDKFYYKNDTNTGYYLYTDRAWADIYLCKDKTAPYSDALKITDHTSSGNYFAPNEKICWTTYKNRRGYMAVIEFFLKESVPATGDSTPVVPLASLVVLTGCGIILLRRRRAQ